MRGLLTLTHSSRRTNLDRCSVQFLTRRFADRERLRHLPPFASLAPAEALYSGSVSFFHLAIDGARLAVTPCGRIKDRDKIQHVTAGDDGELLVGYEHRLEVWRLPAPPGALRRIRRRDRAVTARWEHPWLAGLHTVEPLGGDLVALSCSAADAVLLWNRRTGRLERTLRLPAELYGRGYDLLPERDLRHHYVADGCQTTHVNAASLSPEGERLVVSTLHQGAIGLFDLATGSYRELARGFVGCHGARFASDGTIYFADSTTGTLVFLDPDGAVHRRFAVPSRWLHDVQQLAGPLYAFALAEPNELRIHDVDADRLLYRRRFFRWPFEGGFEVAYRLPFWRGNSCQGLGFRAL